jgi:uncharacterized protein (UPF0335 family)
MTNSTDAIKEITGVGHNSAVNAGEIRAFVERIERMNEEITARNQDKKEIFAEAKGSGYDPKILKKVVALRAQDRDKRIEEETILDLYLSALGMS